VVISRIASRTSDRSEARPAEVRQTLDCASGYALGCIVWFRRWFAYHTHHEARKAVVFWPAEAKRFSELVERGRRAFEIDGGAAVVAA
jgi:hypothetical protein